MYEPPRGKSDLLVGGFITLADQFWIAYQVVIMFSVLLIFIVAFLPETLYPRGTMLSLGAGALAAEKVNLNTITIKRTRQLPFVVDLRCNEILTALELSSRAGGIPSKAMAYSGSLCSDVVVSNHRHFCPRLLLSSLLVATLTSHYVSGRIPQFRPRHSRSVDDRFDPGYACFRDILLWPSVRLDCPQTCQEKQQC